MSKCASQKPHWHLLLSFASLFHLSLNSASPPTTTFYPVSFFKGSVLIPQAFSAVLYSPSSWPLCHAPSILCRFFSVLPHLIPPTWSPPSIVILLTSEGQKSWHKFPGPEYLIELGQVQRMWWWWSDEFLIAVCICAGACARACVSGSVPFNWSCHGVKDWFLSHETDTCPVCMKAFVFRLGEAVRGGVLSVCVELESTCQHLWVFCFCGGVFFWVCDGEMLVPNRETEAQLDGLKLNVL